MTQTRLQALEAVAEAARYYVLQRGMSPTWQDLNAAVQALDARLADPTLARGEVVEVALFGTVQGERCLGDPSSRFALRLQMDGWTRIGTVRLPLVKGEGA